MIVDTRLDKSFYLPGNTATVLGGVTSETRTIENVRLILEVRKSLDDSLVLSLIDVITTLVLNVQKNWSDLLGHACTFIVPTDPTYLKVSLLNLDFSPIYPRIEGETMSKGLADLGFQAVTEIDDEVVDTRGVADIDEVRVEVD